MTDNSPSLPTWNQLDEMADSDPLALRDLAWRLVQTLDRVQPLRDEARERLARHLYLREVPGDWRPHHELLWDRRSERIDFDAVYRRADELLTVIGGQV